MASFLFFLDVDCTLVDITAHIFGGIAHAFPTLRCSMPPPQFVLYCVRLWLLEVFYRLMPQVGHGERDLVERAFEEYFAAQRADQSNPNFYVGILPLSRQFDQDPQFVLGVAVGNLRRGLGALLEASGLRSCFFAAQTADEHPSKTNFACCIRL